VDDVLDTDNEGGADASRSPRGDRDGARLRSGCGGVDVAGRWARPPAFRLRPRAPIRGGAASRHRHRRRPGCAGARPGRGHGHVRGQRALVGDDRHDRDPGRARRLAHAPRLRPGCPRRSCRRGRGARHGRDKQRRGARPAVRSSRHPGRGPGAGLPRSGVAASAEGGPAAGIRRSCGQRRRRRGRKRCARHDACPGARPARARSRRAAAGRGGVRPDARPGRRPEPARNPGRASPAGRGRPCRRTGGCRPRARRDGGPTGRRGRRRAQACASAGAHPCHARRTADAVVRGTHLAARSASAPHCGRAGGGRSSGRAGHSCARARPCATAPVRRSSRRVCG
jgi:hypothetical protein